MELFVSNGSLEGIATFVGGVRPTEDTLTIDYPVLLVDGFDPLANLTDSVLLLPPHSSQL